jgi:inositol transport system substrate-binding protein
MKKKLVGLLLVTAMLLVMVCGCAVNTPEESASDPVADTPAEEPTKEVLVEAPEQAPAEGEKIIVGSTLQDLSNEFIANMADAMSARAKNEYPNMDLQILDAEGDATKQIQQMDTFISSGVDAIILCPRDANALIPSVKNALAAGIPVITISADIAENVGQACVTSLNPDGGALEAQWVVDQLGGKGNIAIMRGPIGADAEMGRFEGYEKVFSQYPDIKIVFDQTGNWSREEGLALMENWLQTGTQIDAVVAQNDEMVLGAIQAIKDAGKLDSIVTAGIDGVLDALDSIKKGELGATCFQDAIGQAFGAVDRANMASTGGEISFNNIPFELVTKDNVDEYYDKISIDTYK